MRRGNIRASRWSGDHGLKIIVAYDIGSTVKREKFARFLMRQGLERIQRSLFIGRGSGQIVKDITRYADKIIEKDRDCVHIFMLNDNEYLMAKVIGTPWGGEEELVQAAVIV